jgi:uncharacterized membrane protein
MGINKGKVVNYHKIYAAIFIIVITLTSDIMLTRILETSCINIPKELFYYRIFICVSVFLYVFWLISTSTHNRRTDARCDDYCK